MYNVSDWYWSVGGDPNNVWSSARAMSVPTTDTAYTDWLAINTRGPTPIDTMANLPGVFAVQFPQGSLQTYNAYARYNRATGGFTVSAISAVPFLTDPVSRNTIDSANTYAVNNPGHITDWKMSDGSFIQLTGAQLATVLQDVATFVQACFTCESQNLAAITGGTITTLAEIDTAFAAIANSK
jgi:hypothetical protein